MHLTKKHRFTAVLIDNDIRMIRPKSYSINWTLRTEKDPELTLEDVSFQQNMSYQVISYFLKEYLSDVVVYDLDSQFMVESGIAEYENSLVVLPKLNESTLATALHCKLNTLCLPNSIVESVELTDLNDELSYTYYNDELDYPSLPDAEEWQGPLSFWDTSWWFRKDFSMFDNHAISQEELDKWKVNDTEQEQISQLAKEYYNTLDTFSKMYKEQFEPPIEKGKVIELHADTPKKPNLKIVPPKPKE